MTIEDAFNNIQDLLTEIMKSNHKQEEMLRMFITGVQEWKAEDQQQHAERLPAYKETTAAIRELISLFEEKEKAQEAVGLTLPTAR